MCDIAEQKRKLRARFRALRAEAHTAAADGRIAANAARYPFGAAERFFVYWSVGAEADTHALVAALRAAGKQVFLPRIADGNMIAVPFGRLERGAYGIPAPSGGTDTPCDAAIVPLLAVDKFGVRLGSGGGFYDRYFAAHPAMLRVGLCYDVQRTDVLPREGHDLPLHAVITDCGIFPCDA